ncbi:MAG: tyrosine-type recombinase/integrase [bacterium]|nr:tyrosine-type recombinase/integrase [bacterium]
MAATLALRGGAQIHQIQAMLGHKDPRTTQRYAHVIDRAANNPAEFVEVVL